MTKNSPGPGAPWRSRPPDVEALQRASRDFLAALVPPEEEALLQASAGRVADAWSEDLLAGYREDPVAVVTAFPSGDDRALVVVRDVEFTSFCVHHLLPFFGKAHLAYLPGESLTGISKLARLVDTLSRRLQIQERMTREIVDVMESALEPVGAAVVVEAEHLCMTVRGVRRRGSRVITTAWSGRFAAEAEERRFLLAALGFPGGS